MTCALPSVRTPPTVPHVSAGGDDDARCLGVDIGGTTIKYAVVDPVRGTTVGPVRRVPTTSVASPSRNTARPPTNTAFTVSSLRFTIRESPPYCLTGSSA